MNQEERIMRPTLCLAAISAALVSLSVTSSATAQILVCPAHPFHAYLNIPVETIPPLFDHSDDSDSSTNTSEEENSLGYSASLDLFQTADRRRPMVVSAFYDNFRLSETFSTSYTQVNGVTNTFPGSDRLSAQGVGLQARIYLTSHDFASGSPSSSAFFLSAAEGYYRVAGSHNSVGLALNPIAQSAAETILAPKFSVGFEGFGGCDAQLSYCRFNNLAISDFSGQTLVLQIGRRF